MINYRIEAEREADDAELQGAFFWSQDGRPPGQRSAYVERELRARFVESCAERDALKLRAEELNGHIASANEARDQIDTDANVGDEARSALEKLAGGKTLEQFVASVESAIKALVRECERRGDAKPDAEPAEVTIARPSARAPKSKVGVTTVVLPGLEPSNDVTIREVVRTAAGAKTK